MNILRSILKEEFCKIMEKPWAKIKVKFHNFDISYMIFRISLNVDLLTIY